jgi:hypothetical protein
MWLFSNIETDAAYWTQLFFSSLTDPETQEAGRRRDGKNLIDQWVHIP